ncbi:Non-specific lipid-transfer protein 3 [Linum grandiflorum]
MASANYKLHVVCMLAALMVAILAAGSHGAVTCGQVSSSLAPCFGYIRGMGPLVPGCCNGVRSLSNAANNSPDRQAACRCLKTLAGSIPSIKYGLVGGIPAKCGVNVPFPLNPSTDCNKL